MYSAYRRVAHVCRRGIRGTKRARDGSASKVPVGNCRAWHCPQIFCIVGARLFTHKSSKGRHAAPLHHKNYGFDPIPDVIQRLRVMQPPWHTLAEIDLFLAA
jgi:histone acetyltransferase (RNA polymerase elongator complex component)